MCLLCSVVSVVSVPPLISQSLHTSYLQRAAPVEELCLSECFKAIKDKLLNILDVFFIIELGTGLGHCPSVHELN